MKTGYLTISLDVEYAWGRIDNKEKVDFYPFFEKTTEVIDQLLELFDKYDVDVTWACVGRLLENPNDPTSAFNEDLNKYFKHIDSKEVYEDSVLNNSRNSFVSQPSLVDKIQNREQRHEICTHGYNHIFYGESEKELVKQDLNAVKMLHELIGLPAESMVFSKNQESYFDLLKSVGIANYRGVTREHYSNMPYMVKKILRQADAFLPFSPPTVVPELNDHGLLNIPGTLLFRGSHLGIKKYFPVSMLARKGKNSLVQAAKKKEITHLWWHPFNFGFKSRAHFKALEEVLQYSVKLRENGDLKVATMKEVGEKFHNGTL